MVRMVRQISLFLLVATAAAVASPAAVAIEKMGLSSSKERCSAWWTFQKGEKLPSYFARTIQNGKGIEVGFAGAKWSEKGATPARLGVDAIRTVEKAHGGKSLLLFQFKLTKGALEKVEQRLQNGRFIVEWSCPETAKGDWSWVASPAVGAEAAAKPEQPKAAPEKEKAAPEQPKAAAKKGKMATEPPVVAEPKGTATKEPSNENDSLEQFYREQSRELERRTSPSQSKGFVVQGERRLIVTREKALLYAKPEPNAMVVRPLAPGDTLFSASMQGNWYVIRQEGRESFVAAADVRRLEALTNKDEQMLRRLVQRQVTHLSSDQQHVPLREVEVGGEAELSEASDSTAVGSRLPKQFYRYSSFGRRDPFVPFEEPEIDGISIDEVQLVGIIWDSETPLAILEDVRLRGVSYTLREGDEVLNGHVFKISRDEVVFLLTEFGVSRKFSMTLPKLFD